MLNVALVGCGYWGYNYARLFSEITETNLAYVADMEETNLAKVKNPGTKKTQDYKEILSDPSIDAAIIATPSKTHFQIAKAFLEAGKHVLVEKPMVLNSKDGEELIRIAEQEKLNLMVGHVFEYNPGVLKLKELIESGKLGKVYNATAKRLSFGPIRQDINCLWDYAPHDISIGNYLFGKMPINVIASGASYIKDGIEDVVFLTFTYADNILFSIEVNWLSPCKVREVKVIGSDKMAIFDDVNKSETIKIFDKGVKPFGSSKHSHYSSYAEHQLLVRDGDIVIPKVDQSEPLKNMCLEFVKSIKEKRKPTTDGENGLRVVRILEKAQESLKKSSKVSID